MSWSTGYVRGCSLVNMQSAQPTPNETLLFSHLSLPMCAKVTHTAATSSLCDLPYTVEMTRRGKK